MVMVPTDRDRDIFRLSLRGAAPLTIGDGDCDSTVIRQARNLDEHRGVVPPSFSTRRARLESTQRMNSGLAGQ